MFSLKFFIVLIKMLKNWLLITEKQHPGKSLNKGQQGNNATAVIEMALLVGGENERSKMIN
jgi:hypothetical protein